MKRKSLIVSGALALSLLAAPATSLASTGESHTYKVDQKNINIEGVMDWIAQNKDELRDNRSNEIDIQSLLNQFQVTERDFEQQAPNQAQQQAPANEQSQQEGTTKEQPKEQSETAEVPQEQPAPAEQATKKEEKSDQVQNSSEVSAFEQQVIELTNQERAKQGLAPLKLDAELSATAKDKSLDMQNKDYFSHNSPTYGSPFDMMNTYGIDYTTAGENIAMGQTSPEQVVEGWMNSEGHRKNIMNPSFTHIGVGYAEEGNYWTQMFIAK